jgi:hypothetical protein
MVRLNREFECCNYNFCEEAASDAVTAMAQTRIDFTVRQETESCRSELHNDVSFPIFFRGGTQIV